VLAGEPMRYEQHMRCTIPDLGQIKEKLEAAKDPEFNKDVVSGREQRRQKPDRRV